MSNHVMLTNTDYQSICDKLREKTGNVNLIKSGDIVGEIELISNFADTINVTNLADNIIDKSIVGIVDEMGTFFQTEEPSYDIWVNNENGGRCLYKHVRQRDVRKDENSAEE